MRTALQWIAWGVLVVPPATAQTDITVAPTGDSVIIRLVDVEVRAAVRALAPYLDRPVTFGPLQNQRISLEVPAPVARSTVATLLRAVLNAQGLDMIQDSTDMYVVRSRSAAGNPGVTAGSPSSTIPAAGPASAAPELFVIRLNHARAADVAATVNALYGKSGAFMEPGDNGNTPTLRRQLGANRVPTGPPPSRAVQEVAGRSAELGGDVVIVPDEATNSLLIRAGREDFALIEATVNQVDIRPLQVLIEVLIVEARKDRSFSFGVDASVDDYAVPDTRNTTVSGSSKGLGLADFVVRVMGIGSIDLNATLTAAVARGEVSIVSRPVVLATNNEWAAIVVGSQRPFVQVSRSLPTETPTRDQVIQYKDVGTELHVRPTISEDGFVTLEVNQQVNAATSETAFDAPVISTRSIETKLLIRDGQTVVLGGLTDRQRDASHGGVPLLSDVPIVGGLFGHRSERTVETELFVFLTPRLLVDDTTTDAATRPMLDRAGQIRQHR